MKTDEIFGVRSDKLPKGAGIQAETFEGQSAKYLTQAEQDAQAKPSKKTFKTADLFGKPSAVKKAGVFKTADLFGPASKSPEVQKAEHANALERMVWTNWAGIDPAFVDEYKTRDPSAQEKLANFFIGPASALIPGQTGRNARESLILGLAPIAEVFNRFLERPVASQLVPLAKNIFLGEPLPEAEPPKFIKDHLPKEMQDPQVWGGIRNLLNAYFTVKPSEFEQLRGYKLNKERPEIGDIFRARNAALGIDPKIGEPLAAIGGLAARTLMPDVYAGSKIIAKKTPGAIKTTAELFGEGAQVTGTIIKETAKEIPGAVKAGVKGAKEMVSETAKGLVDQVVGNVDALYKNFKGTTDKQTFVKMMTEKGYPKDVSGKLADAFDDFVKKNGPQADIQPEYVTKALFNVDRPGVSVRAETKTAQDIAGEVAGVRTQVEQLEKTAKDLVAAGKPVPKDFLDNIQKLKASAPMPELKPRESQKRKVTLVEIGRGNFAPFDASTGEKIGNATYASREVYEGLHGKDNEVVNGNQAPSAGEPAVEEPKDEAFDLAVDFVEERIKNGWTEKDIKSMNMGTIVGKGTNIDTKTWTSRGKKVDLDEVYKTASKRVKDAETLKTEESKVESLKGKRSKKAIKERAASEEKIEKVKSPKAKKPKIQPEEVVTPEAEAEVTKMVGSDSTIKRTEQNADGTNKYWVQLETEYNGYKISAAVRKSDGFTGHKPSKWTIKDAEDNYFHAPNFETFEEVKKWMDDDGPDILTEGELEDAKLEDVNSTIKYLSQKKDLTDKEKRVLDASKNQVSIRKELGIDQDDETHGFETSGMPVKLTEDKAILKDGTIIRRTPKGQPTVKDLVSEGDHISVQGSSYDDDGNLVYDDKSIHMVTKVTEWKKNGLPVYQISYTSIDTPRNKDGSIKKGNEGYTDVLVAQDGEIKPFKEKSNFPQKIEVVAKAGEEGEQPAKAPVLPKKAPEYEVKKAEIRPYRRPDGSIGYEAVPIAEEVKPAPKAEPSLEGLTEEQKAAAKKQTISDLEALSKRQFPFEADDGIKVLGQINAFPPYNETAKKPDWGQLLTEKDGEQAIRMATQITVNGKPLVRRAPSSREPSKFEKMLKDHGKLSYEDFSKQYRDAFKQSAKYSPKEIGFQTYTEEMAKLAEEYPDYLERLEAEEEKGATLPKEGKPNETGKEAVGTTGQNTGAEPGSANRGDSVSPGIDNARSGGIPESDIQQPGGAERGDSERRRTDFEESTERVAEQVASGDTGSNYKITDTDALGVGSPQKKFKDNLTAIKTLKKIEAESREATPEEQAVLVKYVGWGGLKKYFDNKNQDSEDFKELKSLLSEKEYAEARASVTNAHYTSPEIIKAMWVAVGRLGFKTGRVLEPGMGIGNFIGLRPAGRISFTGVELDGITGRIARQLYQQADIHVMGFEDAKLSADYYDLAISNVPFANTQPVDRRAKELGIPQGLSLHDFFFAKSLALVRPGGLIAFITSRYTLDKQADTFRKDIEQKADFLGSIRLPRTAFKSNAGTEVVTDIIFLRKRIAGEQTVSMTWVNSKPKKIGEEDVFVNEFYENNPSMILGTEKLSRGLYSDSEYTVEPTGEITAQIEEAINNLPKNVMTSAMEAQKKSQEVRIKEDVPGHLKDDNLFEREGVIYQKINSQEAKKVDFGSGTEAVKGLINIRNIMKELLFAQQNGASDADVEFQQKKLNKAYDKFVSKHGPISSKSNQKLFADDPDVYFMTAQEDVDKKTGIVNKSDLFSKRVVIPSKPVEKVSTVQEGLLVSLNEFGKVDIDHIAKISGQDKASVIQQLLQDGTIFNNPQTEAYETKDEYLSGRVKEKLIVAQRAAAKNPEYAPNVEAMEKVIPADIPFTNIQVRIGSPWVSDNDYKMFLAYLLEGHHSQFNVMRNSARGNWEISFTGYNRKNNTVYGLPIRGFSAVDLFEKSANNKVIAVYDILEDKSKVLNQVQTEDAKEKAALIKEQFADWIWKDSVRRDRLAREYNDKFNDSVERKHDGSHLTFPGMNPNIKLRKSQINAIWRIVQTRKALLAHAVGAGKTYTMIAAAMEMKRLGLIRKPMVAVLNATLNQFANDWRKLYPQANILVADEKNFSGDKREGFLAKIATKDWDAVIITHSAFGYINVSPELYDDFLSEQIAELQDFMAQKQASEGRKARVGDEENAIRRLKDKIKLKFDESKKDRTLTFEELSVDMLFVDEAQEFKNLMYQTGMQKVAGLGNKTGSAKAEDLFIKTRHLQKINNGTGIVFATGTPILNTLAEAYSMMRYLQPDRLKELGIKHFDQWANQFGEIVSQLEVRPTGEGFRLNNRFSKVININQLMKIVKEVWDMYTAEMLEDDGILRRGYELPRLKGDRADSKYAPKTPELERYIQDLKVRYEKCLGKKPEKGVDNVLVVVGDGRKAAVDVRLVMPGAENSSESKLNLMIDGVYEVWKKGQKTKSTQIIHFDLMKPKKGSQDMSEEEEDLIESQNVSKTGFDPYQEMMTRWVGMGIPAKQIAFINDAKGSKERQAIFEKVKTGEIRILVGSRAKLGIGVNVQDKLIAKWDLDVPWRPGDLIQGDGRIMRPGNENKEVMIIRMVTRGSFDVYMWQTLEAKASALNQLLSGKEIEGNVIEEDTGEFEMIKAEASDNPMLMEKMATDAEVRRLSSLKKSFQIRKDQDDRFLAAYDEKLKKAQAGVKLAKDRLAKLPKERPTKENKLFKMTVNGKEYTDKKEAGEALLTNYERVQRGNTIGYLARAGTSFGEFMGYSIFGANGLEGALVKITLGPDVIGSFAMGGSPEGTVQAIINRIFDGPEGDVADGEAYIARLEREKKAIETEGNSEFRYEKNLTEMTAKQRELDKKLREMAMKKDEPKSPDVAQEIQEQAAPLTDDLMDDPEAGFARVSTGEKINDDIQAVQFSDPEIEKRFKDANGMASKQSLKQSIYDLWAGAVSQLRQYPTLPEKKEFFPIKQILDKQKNVRKVAQDRAIRSINAITAKLGPKKLDLFTRKVILDDLFREARAGRPIPFGYAQIDPETGVLTIRMETLEKDKANIDALVERNPDVKDAVLMRSRLWDAVQQDLIRYKILKESQVKEDYFRHQVLEHAQLKATFGPGKKIKTPTPGYAKQRRGSTFDINSSYLEAEMEVLSQSFHDIETARNIESIENSELNILKSLKAKAKAENEANIMGYFQKLIETEQAKGNPEYLGETAKSLYKKTLNVKQAMGIAKISRMASEGLLPTGESDEWEDVVNSLAERYTDGEGAEIEDGRLFKYLAYLSKLKDEAGAKAAALVFAGVAEKKRFFIETLGDKFKTWEDMIPEGYRTWQPLEGRVFYSAYSVPQKVVSEVMSNTTPEMGEYGITKEDLHKVMAVGGLRKQLVLPEEVAATLDELYTAPPLSAVFKAARQLTTMWKLNILFNPRRAFKYNFQNFIGDSDAIIAGNPKIFKKLGRAFGDLKGVFYLNKPMPTEMREYFERGGLDSALTIQEIPDIKKLEIFERFFADTEKKNKGGWDSTFIAKGMNAYWNTITQFTVFREAILRYSAYLHYREVFKAGGKEYAASNPEEIDALEDPLDKAAKVATELLGDYKAVSALTQNMRQFLIPFMSWLEVNAKRYYRLGRNAWAGGDAGAGGRLAGVALKKGAMGLGKWWLRAVAMTAFCSLWNQLFFYEEEGEVSEYDRNRMHLILGRKADGSIIILRGQGAFADILEWFGLDGAPQLFREYFDGKASLVDIFGKIPFITGKIGLKPAAQKIIRGINPLYKLPFETLTGKTLPVFDDRPGRIEDPMRNIFKALAMENEYDFIAQKPSRGYVNSLIQAFVAVQDPEENAFRYIQSQKYEFLEKRHGKGGGGDFYSKKSILYRAYRKALVFKDEAAQNRLIDEMDNLGIKGDDLTKSLERSHPLSGLTKAEEKEFTQDFLSDADLDKLESAEEYYEKTFLS